MLTSSEINALGQVLNTSWGNASTPNGSFPLGSAPQYSLKGEIHGVTNINLDKDGGQTDDVRVVVRYTTVVTFRYQQEAEAEKRRFRKEAEKLCAEYLKRIKAGFKEISGRALKTKQLEESDGCEVFHTGETLSFYTQRYRPDIHRAYYRYAVVLSAR